MSNYTVYIMKYDVNYMIINGYESAQNVDLIASDSISYWANSECYYLW